MSEADRPFSRGRVNMLSMSTDGTIGFKLDDSPPFPRTEPGGVTMLDYRIQDGPRLFGRLLISRQIGISKAGEAVMSVADSWRVDDVTLDGTPVELTNGSVEPPRSASRVTMTITNIGDVPAYFYGSWELHEALVAASADGTLEIWDLESGPLARHRETVVADPTPEVRSG